MKVLFSLFALIAVALARPQNLPFYEEGVQIGQKIQFLSPQVQVLDQGVLPLVNQLENIPYTQDVDLVRFLTNLDSAVSANLQRSVAQHLS